MNKLFSAFRALSMAMVNRLVKRSRSRAEIEIDIHRWILMNNPLLREASVEKKLEWLLFIHHMEEFRNLFYYRLDLPSSALDRLLLKLVKRIFPPRQTIHLSSPSIGAGLVIKHGVLMVIDAEKIGENCLIFQEAVIGSRSDDEEDLPTLGNYVHVSVGAKVLGRITVGDHAVIAANTVVTKNMPPNSLAVGVPARIIKNAGNRSEYVAAGLIPE